MNGNTILSGSALAVGLLAFIVVLARPSKPNREAEEKQLQQMVDQKIEASTQALRAELAKKLDGDIAALGLNTDAQTDLIGTDLEGLMQKAKTDPEVEKLLKAGVQAVILNAMADQLKTVDWSDTLSQEKLQKLLNNESNNWMPIGMDRFGAPLDLSGIDGTDAKIARILQEFNGSFYYKNDNALVKQMAGMGKEAVEPLIAQLNNNHGFPLREAITDALSKLLTADDEDLILEEFTKNGNFADLVKKFQFPAAEDEVMNKISYPMNGAVNNDVIDAALKMNRERSIPLLIDYVTHGQNVGYAAAQLSAEGVDITEPLRSAAKRAGSFCEKAELVEPCLDRNMPEGYDLAVEVLRSTDKNAKYQQDKVYQYVRKYTGINCSYEEAAAWLDNNRPH